MRTLALSSPDLIDTCKRYLLAKRYPEIIPVADTQSLMLQTLQSTEDNVVVFTTTFDSVLFMYLSENRRSLGAVKIFTNDRGTGVLYNNAQFDVYRLTNIPNVPLDMDFNSYHNILKLDRTASQSYVDLFKFDASKPVTVACYDTTLNKVLNTVPIDYEPFNVDSHIDRDADRLYRIVNADNGVILGGLTASELAKKREREAELRRASAEAQGFRAAGQIPRDESGVLNAAQELLGMGLRRAGIVDSESEVPTAPGFGSGGTGAGTGGGTGAGMGAGTGAGTQGPTPYRDEGLNGGQQVARAAGVTLTAVGAQQKAPAPKAVQRRQQPQQASQSPQTQQPQQPQQAQQTQAQVQFGAQQQMQTPEIQQPQTQVQVQFGAQQVPAQPSMQVQLGKQTPVNREQRRQMARQQSNGSPNYPVYQQPQMGVQTAQRKQKILTGLSKKLVYVPSAQAPITPELALQLIETQGPLGLLSYQAREEVRLGLFELGERYTQSAEQEGRVRVAKDTRKRILLGAPGEKKKSKGKLIEDPGDLAKNGSKVKAPKQEKITGDLIRHARQDDDDDEELLTPEQLQEKMRQRALLAAQRSKAGSTGEIVAPENLESEQNQLAAPEERDEDGNLIEAPQEVNLVDKLMKAPGALAGLVKPKDGSKLAKPEKPKAQRIEVASGDYLAEKKVAKVFVADEALDIAQRHTAANVEGDMHASEVIAAALETEKRKALERDEHERKKHGSERDNSKIIKGFIKRDTGLKGALASMFKSPKDEDEEILQDVGIDLDFSSLRTQDIVNESSALGLADLYGSQVAIYASIEEKLIQEGHLTAEDVEKLHEEQRRMKAERNLTMSFIEVAVLLSYIDADTALNALSEFEGSEVMTEDSVMECDVVTDTFKQDVCKKYAFFVTTGLDGRKQFVTYIGNNLEYSLGTHYFDAVVRYTLRQYVLKRIKTWDKW